MIFFKPLILAVQKQINDMKNVRKEKLTKLKQNRGVEDAFRAIEWLDKNREMFKGIVYEPMFLLVCILTFKNKLI